VRNLCGRGDGSPTCRPDPASDRSRSRSVLKVVSAGFARKSGIRRSKVSELTRILDAAQNGDPAAADQLLPLVYDELRRIAAQKMAREMPGQTLHPTALVHEAWLRLGADQQTNWQNRAHFLGAAAEAMRRILVENARRKLRLKRGGGNERTTLDEAALEAPPEDEKGVASERSARSARE
jgi:RNA polymerase sigma factor (TIGR02999 family)